MKLNCQGVLFLVISFTLGACGKKTLDRKDNGQFNTRSNGVSDPTSEQAFAAMDTFSEISALQISGDLSALNLNQGYLYLPYDNPSVWVGQRSEELFYRTGQAFNTPFGNYYNEIYLRQVSLVSSEEKHFKIEVPSDILVDVYSTIRTPHGIVFKAVVKNTFANCTTFDRFYTAPVFLNFNTGKIEKLLTPIKPIVNSGACQVQGIEDYQVSPNGNYLAITANNTNISFEDIPDYSNSNDCRFSGCSITRVYVKNITTGSFVSVIGKANLHPLGSVNSVVFDPNSQDIYFMRDGEQFMDNDNPNNYFQQLLVYSLAQETVNTYKIAGMEGSRFTSTGVIYGNKGSNLYLIDDTHYLGQRIYKVQTGANKTALAQVIYNVPSTEYPLYEMLPIMNDLILNASGNTLTLHLQLSASPWTTRDVAVPF